MPLAGYNTGIVIEQGGSIMNFASATSLTLAAGTQATISGNASVAAAGLLAFAAAGSLNFNTPLAGTAFRFITATGPSQPSIGAGGEIPVHSAPMGSLYIRANGSISGLYINITQDANGSTWRLMQQGSAIG